MCTGGWFKQANFQEIGLIKLLPIPKYLAGLQGQILS